MQRVPSAAEIRARVGPLDVVDRRVLGGLVAVMIAEPSRVRDREWMAEQFVRLAVIAHGHSHGAMPTTTDAATTADVARIQAYVRARQAELFTAAIELFVRVAADLRAQVGYTFDDARARVTDYLAS